VGQRIAVVGAGISGLGAAWALHRDNEIVVYEADERLGGHSNTVEVETPSGAVPVDTGFIVYNEVTYPHLTRLFSALGVNTEESDMSFAFSMGKSFEYAASARGLVAQPTNLLRASYRSMISDIIRFRRIGPELRPRQDETIDELLDRHGFGAAFLEEYLLPMTASIWSARQNEIRKFPAVSILRFLNNHGLIRITDRPLWRTVSGGSREYVRRLAHPFMDRVRVATPVTLVERYEDRVEITANGRRESFDQLVLATHSDQSLAILGRNATDTERNVLGEIRYEPNHAVLHSDPSLMPTRRRVWSSWNAMVSPADRGSRVASVTYWMNRLQRLDTEQQLFVSLNPIQDPDPSLIHRRFDYAHPQFDHRTVDAQRRLAKIQGARRTWFAGAYCGDGFHEDGLQAGLNVAAALGSPPPWWGSFEPMSSSLPPDRIGALV
jgi:hypothetical protein